MKNDNSRHRLSEFARTATGEAYFRLQAKLDEFPSNEIVTTIITYEEQMRGTYEEQMKNKCAVGCHI